MEIISYENYVKSCKIFAEDTKEWDELPDNLCYTTVAPFGWDETSDNEHGGLYVDWAFHLDEKEIEKHAKDYYDNEVTAITEC